MVTGDWSGDIVDPHEAFCVDGCGRLAETERIAGLTSRGVEVVELVCHPCRAASMCETAPDRTTTRARLRRAWHTLTRRWTR